MACDYISYILVYMNVLIIMMIDFEVVRYIYIILSFYLSLIMPDFELKIKKTANKNTKNTKKKWKKKTLNSTLWRIV